MKFALIHNNKQYGFDTADELYIFGLAIELEMETKYNIDINKFVAFVNKCHMENCLHTPLKPFAKFIAKWHTELQERDPVFVVNKFYEIQDL